MSIKDRLRTNSTIKETSVLTDSKVLCETAVLTTNIPLINIALSGKIDGGLMPGVLTIAGPSKHFKSNFALMFMRMFLDSHPDAVVLFYDSEFGTPKSYWDTFGIDRDRVIHTPVVDVEEWKIDCYKQLQGMVRGDRVLIVVDSIGQLASRKEVDDANDQKTVGDMSRAKSLKSAFRLLISQLKLKFIPMIAINHTYKTLEMFSHDVVGGGTGGMFGSDNVWIIGRQQEKDGKDLTGFSFIINADKSRYIKEKSKLSIEVDFDKGIERYSGLLDIAIEGGFVVKPKNGYYSRPNIDLPDVKFKEDATYSDDFWTPLLKNVDFVKFLENKYALPDRPIYNLAQATDTSEDEDA